MALKPIILETERLIMKGFSPQDMTYIFGNYDKADIMKLLGHRNEDEYQKEEYKQLNGYSSYDRSFLLFLLVDELTNTIIGRCGLHNWNITHHRAEIGYNMVEEDYKQKGFMTEAVNAVIDYGFNALNLNRIEAIVGIGNIASLRILEKYNFIKEGHLRQHHFVSGAYEDSILMSKLNIEYQKELNYTTQR